MAEVANPTPCPFCGLSHSLNLERVEGAPLDAWAIRCDDCGASGPELYPSPSRSREEVLGWAVEVWNRRDPLGPKALSQNIREVAAAALVALPLYAIAAVLIGGV